MFYESEQASCQRNAQALLSATPAPAVAPTVLAGIVPHAGWRYSGKLAAKTIKTLLGNSGQSGVPRTVILFGADHVGTVQMGEVYPYGVWETPLGDVEVDQLLAAELLQECSLLRGNPGAHAREHSIEVQIPILKELLPDVKIVPIGVPVDPLAIQIGAAVGRFLSARHRGDVCVLGSTDMTHTGGHFGHRRHGPGPRAEQYARANDARLLSLVEAMEVEKVLPEVQQQHNACGGGALAATIAAAHQLGATRGTVLEYTNSYVVSRERNPSEQDDTTVGYCSVVFN